MQPITHPISKTDEKRLDSRDIEILQLSSEGYTNDEIANRLCCGGDCVEKRRSRIFKFLKAENMTQAVAEALRKNIIK